MVQSAPPQGQELLLLSGVSDLTDSADFLLNPSCQIGFPGIFGDLTTEAW